MIFAQAIGSFVAIAVEYGFDFSAVRESARYSNDGSRLRNLVAGVLGAKFSIAFLAVLAAFAIRPFTLRVTGSPELYWGSVIWGVAQGINMLWYFQGLQRMSWAAGLDITGKTIATLSIFAFVHNPQDGWKVMAAQALGCGVAHALTLGMAWREVGFRLPTIALIKDALKMGWPMFLFKASLSLMSSANSLILGFFGKPAAVGLFGSADKVRQLTIQALNPVNQALFPHQSKNVADNLQKGAAVVRRSLLMIGGLACCVGLAIIVCAPLIINLLMGARFAAAVPALRIFGILIPISACGGVICFQWMLPLGLDREFNRVVLMAGLINVTLGVLLVPKLGVTGMATALTIADFCAVVAYCVTLQRRGMSPFAKGFSQPVREQRDLVCAAEPVVNEPSLTGSYDA